MPGSTPSQHSPARSTDDDPLLDLIDLLLDALLTATGAPRAEVTVEEPGGLRRERGTAAGRPGIDLTSKAGGRAVRLRVDADESARASAAQFLPLLAASLALDGRLRDQIAQADAAVESVEATAMADLATGIVMARTGRSAAAARAVLTDWADRHGTKIGELSADAVLEVLTAGDL